MSLQKLVSFFAITNMRTTPLQMLDLVKACILNFGREAFLNPTILNLAGLTARSMHFANVLLECLGH
jgi:hypothetical protein